MTSVSAGFSAFDLILAGTPTLPLPQMLLRLLLIMHLETSYSCAPSYSRFSLSCFSSALSDEFL